jgi:cell division protein FtsB
MKSLSAVLLVLFAGLQYQIWFGQSGAMAQQRLAGQVAEQKVHMEQLELRNRKMVAEVVALQSGKAAFEARARSELGLVKKGEVFYLIPDETKP